MLLLAVPSSLMLADCVSSHSDFMTAFLPPPLCSVAIGIGFYGNSEANDGMYQLTSSLLTANYTLASIDLLVSSAPLPSLLLCV